MKSFLLLGVGVFLSGFLMSHSDTQSNRSCQNEQIVLGNPIALNGNITNSPLTNKRLALPFTAKTTGSVESLLWWARFEPEPNNGYSRGNGGEIQISIHEDHEGGPKVHHLGELVSVFPAIENRPLRSQLRRDSFQQANVSVTEGKKYWVVFENIYKDSPLWENFVSLNGPRLKNPDKERGKDDPGIEIARPFDNFYLHEQEKDGSWVPYRQATHSSRTTFPFVVVRINGLDQNKLDHGYPFQYGPVHGPLKSKRVSGLNRIRQTATFSSDVLSEPINDATLYFYAQELSAKDSSEVVVKVNDVVQGIAKVGKQNWYAVHLDTNIEPDVTYEIEFSARAQADVRISQGIDGFLLRLKKERNYSGHLTYSEDGGRTWKDPTKFEGVQASFFITPTPVE